MKLPRRRYWVPLLLVIVFAACVRFHLHYHVIGLFRGDAYYRGLPTCYWRDSATTLVKGSPSWIVRAYRFVGARPVNFTDYGIFSGEPESTAVLVQLLQDDFIDREVREHLLWALDRWQGKADEELLAAVRPYLDSQDDQARINAASFLVQQKDESSLPLERLIDAFEKWSRGTPVLRRMVTSRIVKTAIDFPADKVPVLLDLLSRLQQDANPFVRADAAETLAKVRNLAKTPQ